MISYILVLGFVHNIRNLVFQMSGGHKKARPKGPVVQNPNSFRMERPPDGPPVELENQFILRLPTVCSSHQLIQRNIDIISADSKSASDPDILILSTY